MDLRAVPLIPVRQVRRRLTEELEHVLRLRLKRPLSNRVHRRVPRIRRLNRPAAHTSSATTLSLSRVHHLILDGIQAGLILNSKRDRVTQTRRRRRRNHVNTVHVLIRRLTQNADEALTNTHQLRQRAKLDHRLQGAVNVRHLILRRSRQLNQRRRMTNALRLTLQVLILPTTRAAVIRARVELASRRPPIEDARPSRLKRRHRRRPRTLTRLLRRNNLRPAIHERLVQQRTLRPPHRILTDPIMVRRTPKLPIRLTERRAPVKTVRHTTMLLNPSVRQVAQRREVNDELQASIIRHRQPPAGDA